MVSFYGIQQKNTKYFQHREVVTCVNLKSGTEREGLHALLTNG